MVIQMSFYLNKKNSMTLLNEFLDFIKDKRLVIHNAEFDISHLNNELSIIGKNKIQQEVVDTLKLAREKFPGSQMQVWMHLCKKFRIDNSRRKNTQQLLIVNCYLKYT